MYLIQFPPPPVYITQRGLLAHFWNGRIEESTGASIFCVYNFFEIGAPGAAGAPQSRKKANFGTLQLASLKSYPDGVCAIGRGKCFPTKKLDATSGPRWTRFR